MAFRHTITQGITQPGGAAGLSGSKSYTGDNKESYDIVVPDPAADVHVNVAIDFSQLISIVMLASVDLVIETNTSAGTDDTINLLAGVPYIWNADAPQDNPFTIDVTAFYLTASGDGEGTFKMEVLQDSTP